MNIAIDCRMIGSGGIGSYLSSLIPYFLENNKCLLIGKKNQIEEFGRNKNADLIYCDIKPFSIKELFTFPKSICDKINSCDLYYTAYCNIPCGIKIPVFSTIHDVIFLDIPLASKIGTWIRKFFYQHGINRSQVIFTVSNFSKSRIKENLKCNKEILIAPPALSPWFEKLPKSNEKTGSLLFVGNIKKHKGLRSLIIAYKKLLDSGFNTKLIIVGNADNFRTKDNELQQMISEFNENQIKFTGKISNEELYDYYKKANLLIQPSLYEGFGIPPLEAMTLGTNVILSDIPVFKEIYQDYPVTFFQVENSDDLAEKIQSAYDKPQPENLPDYYSYKKSFEIIYNKMNDFLQKRV